MKRRIYRLEREGRLAGVLAGMGRAMDLDPNLLRLAFLVLAVATGGLPMVLAYAAAALLIPRYPWHGHHWGV